LISGILSNDKTKFSAGSMDNWAKSNSKFDPGESLDWVDEFLLAAPLSQQTRTDLARLAKDSGGNLPNLLSALAALPEFQLN
jgi:hypothetical protein